MPSQLNKLMIHAANLGAAVLPDDRFSMRVRVLLYRCAGINMPLRTKLRRGCYMGIGGKNIHLGTGVAVNRNCYFDLCGDIYIEDNVSIGHGTTFITAKHAVGPREKRAGPISSTPSTRVETGAWIGANSTILPGVVIGHGSIVASGSVVTKDVPPDCLVAGNPATTKRWLE